MLKNSRSIAIILELENLEEGMEERAQINLLELQKQIAEIYEILPRPVTLKVVFDSNDHSLAEAESFIRSAGMDRNPLITVEAIGEPRIDYYQHKDLGSSKCDDDIILYLDSDVLIGPGYLRSMVTAFDGDVNFVTGLTTIEAEKFFDKFYAISSPAFYPEIPQSAELVPTTKILTNSFAYRRDRVSGPLFPERDAYRGQCWVASQRLVARGETIYFNPAAVARHPSLSTLGAYLARGFTEGRDRIVLTRDGPLLSGATTVRSRLARHLPSTCRRLYRNGIGAIKRAFTRYKLVSLPPVAVPLAAVMGVAYYIMVFLGEVTTLISDRLARRLSLMG